MVLSLLLSDVLVGLGCLYAALAVNAVWDGVLFASEDLVVGVAPSLALWIVLRLLLGLYPGYGSDPAQDLRLQSYSSIATFAVLAPVQVVILDLVAHLPPGGNAYLYLFLVLVASAIILMAPVARSATKSALIRSGLWGKRVVILGGGKVAARLASAMLKDREQGFKPVAAFSDSEDDTPDIEEDMPIGVPSSVPYLERRDNVPIFPNSEEGTPDTPASVPYLGGLENAPVFARNFGINTAIIAPEGLSHAELDELADWASTSFRRVIKAMPSLTGLSSSTIAARDLAGVLGVEVRHNLLDPWSRRTKRAIDLFGTLVGGMLIAPLLLAIAALIWAETRGAVFYVDRRLGRDGKAFSCIKFRTMSPNAEEALKKLLEESPAAREEYSIYHKLRDDPRVTRVGRFLRKTSLDELPQLWNVLKGEMSLVGPRPYLPRESIDIGSSQRVILRVPPGITGPWQVSGRNALSFDERVEVDLSYIRNWSVWMDLILLARTVAIVVFRRGAY